MVDDEQVHDVCCGLGRLRLISHAAQPGRGMRRPSPLIEARPEHAVGADAHGDGTTVKVRQGHGSDGQVIAQQIALSHAGLWPVDLGEARDRHRVLPHLPDRGVGSCAHGMSPFRRTSRL